MAELQAAYQALFRRGLFTNTEQKERWIGAIFPIDQAQKQKVTTKGRLFSKSL
jgi:hypothetical protein